MQILVSGSPLSRILLLTPCTMTFDAVCCHFGGTWAPRRSFVWRGLRMLHIFMVSTPMGHLASSCEYVKPCNGQSQLTLSFELLVGSAMTCCGFLRPHLHTLLLEDWRQHVAAGVFHRHDFAGISGLDYWASFQVLPQLTVSQTELLATIRDGTFFLHSFKARFDPGFLGGLSFLFLCFGFHGASSM